MKRCAYILQRVICEFTNPIGFDIHLCRSFYSGAKSYFCLSFV